MLLAEMLAAASAQGQEAAKSASGTAAAQTAVAAMADASYRIGPQDVLRIDVWKETEISRSVPVRPDGKISLPLLNDVQASGLTAMELSNNITEGLKKFINNPQVTVSVT
jgi:polysaccharide export outer membrane protein